MHHILAARQFDTKQLTGLFDHARQMQVMSQEDTGRRTLLERHMGRIMAALFYEPSTRTRLSFESAACRLGMSVIGTENAAEFSSAAKGETLEDSIRVIASYADVIVMRHKEKGAAERAAVASSKPIINAGDGAGEHPTQALLDMYTIQREKGRLDGLQIVIGGDLKHGRTARSLAQLLALYPRNTITFVSPKQLRIGDDIKAYLDTYQTAYMETDDTNEALTAADVVYWTRSQTERHAGNHTIATEYTLDKRSLAVMKRDAIIMHPLPRVTEIATEVDADPRAAYFRQTENGLYVRMALLDQVVSKF